MSLLKMYMITLSVVIFFVYTGILPKGRRGTWVNGNKETRKASSVSLKLGGLGTYCQVLDV